MKNKNKLLRFALILYSVLSLLSTVYLIFQSQESSRDPVYEKTKQELRDIKQYLKSKDSLYDRSLDSLEKVSDSLQQVIIKNDHKLNSSRAYAYGLSVKIETYSEKFEKDTALKKDAPAFDSLMVLSKSYLIASLARDSLCDSEIASLNCLLEVKDVQLLTKDSLVMDYKSTVSRLMFSVSELSQEIISARKKYKRSRLASRILLSAATILAGGFTIRNMIHD